MFHQLHRVQINLRFFKLHISHELEHSSTREWTQISRCHSLHIELSCENLREHIWRMKKKSNSYLTELPTVKFLYDQWKHVSIKNKQLNTVSSIFKILREVCERMKGGKRWESSEKWKKLKCFWNLQRVDYLLKNYSTIALKKFLLCVYFKAINRQLIAWI